MGLGVSSIPAAPSTKFAVSSGVQGSPAVSNDCAESQRAQGRARGLAAAGPWASVGRILRAAAAGGLLLLGVSVPAAALTPNPVPQVNQPVVPDTAAPGGAGFTLTVNGTGFVSASTVDWNGSARTTTFVSATQLTAAITAADIATAGTASITVVNPSPGGGASNVVFFPITNATASAVFANAPGSPVTMGYLPTSVAVGDFNGDGRLDLAVANFCGSDPSCSYGSNGTITILLGNGDGTFSPPMCSGVPCTPPAAGIGPVSVAVGDFNGDGKPDLAVANLNSNNVTILLGNGDGTFTATATSAQVGNNPQSVAVGDFNGDGKLDLAVANACDNVPGCFENPPGSVSNLLGRGDGTFYRPNNSPYLSTGLYPQSVAVGDFNGDGKLDLAVANEGSNTLTIFLGDGAGNFAATATSPATGSGPYSVAVGDFNGDGKLDLAVANSGSNTVTILLGNGDGTFTATATSPATGSTPYSVAVGDFNGDGKLDLAVANFGDNTVTILLGDGTGNFTANATLPATGNGPASVAVGDFNGDGRLDLAVANQNDNTLSVLLQSTTPGAAVSPSSLPFGNQLVGAPSTGQEATLTNNGTGPLTITAIGLSGTNAADFALTFPPSGPCATLPATLVPGPGCTVSVTFTPSAAQPESATLTFTDNANSVPGSTQTVSLSGTGVLLPIAQLSPGSLTFSNQFVGATSAAQTVTLMNTGSAPLAVADIASSGPFAIVMDNTNTCLSASHTLSGTIAVGGSCSFGVTFTPTALGAGTGSITVTDNSYGVSNSTQTVMLSGAGIPYPTPEISQPLAPDSAAPGGGDFTLTVNGAGFGSGSTVYWNGSARSTTFVNATQLTALISGADIRTAGTASVTVVNPAPGGGASNVVFFPITNPTASAFFAKASGSPVTTGSYPISVAVGDFKGDGKLDLAVANGISNNLTILLGNGDGTFSATASPATGSTPYSVAVGDFNGDGIPDLAVANAGSRSLTILLGKGDGTFAPPTCNGSPCPPPTSGYTVSVAVGDFNGDGIPDLAAANEGSSSVTILLGNGDGTFSSPQCSGSPCTPPATGRYPFSVAVGDFNGDGKLDLAVANEGSNTVTILLGNGDGTFTATAASPSTGSSPYSVAVGDFNGDGKLDLAVANFGSSTVTILLGNGDGTFTATAASPATGTYPTSVAVGDFNGDGKLDLAVTNQGSNAVNILLGDGTGNFTATATPPATGIDPRSVAVGDFNGDGRLDLAVANQVDNTVSVLLQAPMASLSPSSPPGLAFGNQLVGITGPGQTVTLTNNGSVPLTVSAIGLSGTNFTDFAFTFASNDPCSALPATVLPGAFCTASVTFTPSTVGGESATLTFTDNDRAVPGSTQTVSLSGTGVAPIAKLSPSSLNFGSQLVGTTSAAPTVTLTNTGTATMTIASIVSSGDFSITIASTGTPCGTTLAASASCTFGVAFTPTALGQRTGLVTVTDNSYNVTGSTQTVMLSGTGLAPVAQLAPGSLTFSSQLVNTTSAADTVTLSNTGTVTLSITGIVSSGDFTITTASTGSPCGATLAAAASCAFGVAFTPTATGQRTGSVTVTDNNYEVSGSTQTIMLTGNGIPYPNPQIDQPLVPDTAAPGGRSGFTLTVKGTGFTSRSTVNWNGSSQNIATTFVSATQLTAAIPATDIPAAGTASVTVVNPSPGGGASNVVFFPITNPTSSVFFANAPGSPVTTGSYPTSVAVGDFNGDGIPDLAVVDQCGSDPSCSSDGTITILLGNGNGTFTATATSPATAINPTSVAVGDFNGDGNLDLAVANAGSHNVTILLGDGKGNFTATATSPATGGIPYSVAVGDFNGDGNLDLAVANQGSNTVTILLGDGKGNFTATATSPATGYSPYSVAVGDFNGDGIPDLAVANQCGSDEFCNSNGTITILLGNGDGTFTAAASVATGYSPRSVALGDFNGDGKLDLAVANHCGGDASCANGTISILLGNGNGTFTAAASPATGSGPSSVAVGDLNGDGKLDLAVANFGSNAVTILLGDGTGNFTATATPAATGGTPASVAVADFNGDGRLDLAVANSGGNTLSLLLQAPIASVSPSSPPGLVFGTQLVEFTSTGQTVTLTNNGSASLSVSAIGLSGSNFTDFAFTFASGDPCASLPATPATVLPGAACTASVTFTPSVVGGEGATLTFTDNDSGAPGSTQTVSLSGTGLGYPIAQLGPGSLTFSSQLVGTTSAAQTATLTNAGTATMTIGSIVSSGDFSITAASTGIPCGATLAVAASCTFGVAFTPTARGQRTGSVTVTDNSYNVTGSTQMIALSGTGIGNAVPEIDQPLAPDTAAPGGAGFTLTVNGAGFVPGSTVNWNASANNITTTFVSATQLKAAIPAIDIATAGTASVTVVNPSPGGGASNVVFFPITNATSSVDFANAPGSPVTMGSYPTSVAVGDFNGDGIPDVAVANQNSNSVTILLGNGDGTFTATSASPATGYYPYSVAVGDFNGDGKLDLAVANSCGNDPDCSSPGTVTILLGDGTGNFTATSASPATGYYPYSVAVGDLNGDGIPDLAVANFYDNTVTILLGNGDGTFTATASPATGNGPYSVAVGDFNGDGKLDLAVVNQYDSTVTILLGNGDGTFTATSTTPATGNGPVSVAVGDFNGDGKLDLAVVNQYGNNVTILLGDGTGNFTATSTSPATGYSPSSVAVGDFNGDGKLDLAVANQGSSTATILLGDGTGNFTATATPPATGYGPVSVAVGDFNSDGRLDLAVANQYGNTLSVLLQAPIASLSPSSLVFGNQVVGTATTGQTVTLTNNGSAPLTVSAIGFSGTNAGDFAISFAPSDPCSTLSATPATAATVIPGAACAASVTFTPSALAGESATLTFTDNNSAVPGSTQTVSLTANEPIAQLSPGSLTFGKQFVGTTSAAQTVTLTNTGTATLSVAGITSSGNFTITRASAGTPCGATLAAAANCTFGVTFTPSARGALSGSVTVTDNSYDVSPSTQTTTLFGAGIFNTVPEVNQPLVPQSVAPGGQGFTLTVNGAGFISGATVDWNGSPRATTWVSATQLTAAITATDIATVGTAAITVVNPPPGGGASNVVFFSITNPTSSILFANAPGSPVSVGIIPLSVAVGDFNGDGILDLAVLNQCGSDPTCSSNGTITILLGNGDGTFSPPMCSGNPCPSPAAGYYPYAVAAGDFNGDGKLDLAVANQGNNNVTILLGNGDGTFTATSTSPATGSGPVSVAVGDINGDGTLDLAVINEYDYTVTILLGNGDGTFSPPMCSGNPCPLPATGSNPLSVAVGDFNGDGNLDLAVANQGSSTLTILLGNGDGTFKAAASPATGNRPSSVVVGDFNGDGKLDLAVANFADNTVTILLGDGTGNFTANATSPATGSNPGSVAVGDFNGDGIPDLAVENSCGNDPTCSSGGTVTILLGDGTGNFTATATPPATGNAPASVAVGDFNGDGRLDLAVANQNDNTLSVLLQLTMPRASVSPSSLPFGNQAVGTTSTGQTVTLTNNGTASLTVSAISLSGTNSTDFAFTFAPSDPCATLPATVLPGAFCTASVTFTPSVVGMGGESATLTFTDNDSGAPGSTQTVSLSGTGLPAGQTINFTPPTSPVTYGVSPITLSATGGGSGNPVTFSVLSGPGSITGNTLTVNGAGTIVVAANQSGNANYAAAPQVTESLIVNPAPLTITASSASMTYGGTPPAVTPSYRGFVNGDAAASLTTPPMCSTTATSHSPAGSYTSSCSGAVDSNYTIIYAAGTVTVSPAALVIAASSATMTQGGTVPTITPIYSGFVNGDTAGSLTTPPTCSTTATSTSPPGSYPSSCSGAVDGNYTISYVSGTVTVNPAAILVSLSPSSLTFPAEIAGTSSSAEIVTLTNMGTAPLSISRITASGGFSQTNTCGSTVGAGANCAISVTFKPGAAGTWTGNLSIWDNAAGSPQSVALSGSGVVFTVGPHPPVVPAPAPSLPVPGRPLVPPTVPLPVSPPGTGTEPVVRSPGPIVLPLEAPSLPAPEQPAPPPTVPPTRNLSETGKEYAVGTPGLAVLPLWPPAHQFLLQPPL